MTGRRLWWMVTVIVASAVVLTGGMLTACGSTRTSGMSDWPAVLAPPIGDPRTADPCGLLDKGLVQQRFGSAHLVRNMSNPQTCIVTTEAAILFATFGAPDDEAPDGVAGRIGEFTVSRAEWRDNECRRTVVLHDRSRVYLAAWSLSATATELCAVAEAATQIAVSALSSPSLPRRADTDPPDALTWVDACSLLDQDALEQVQGLDTSRRYRGFAGWQCVWGNNPAVPHSPWVKVAVVRGPPLTDKLVQIGGRSAQVSSGTPNFFNRHPSATCVVDLMHRPFAEATGDRRVELLEIEVFLGGSADSSCASARALAEAAAPRLPPE